MVVSYNILLPLKMGSTDPVVSEAFVNGAVVAPQLAQLQLGTLLALVVPLRGFHC